MQHAGPKFPCELHDRRETIMIIMRAIYRSICRAMILAMYIFHIHLLTTLRLDDYEEMRAWIRWEKMKRMRMIPWRRKNRHRIWIQWFRSNDAKLMKLSMIIMLSYNDIDYRDWRLWLLKFDALWDDEMRQRIWSAWRDDLDPWLIVFACRMASIVSILVSRCELDAFFS